MTINKSPIIITKNNLLSLDLKFKCIFDFLHKKKKLIISAKLIEMVAPIAFNLGINKKHEIKQTIAAKILALRQSFSLPIGTR